MHQIGQVHPKDVARSEIASADDGEDTSASTSKATPREPEQVSWFTGLAIVIDAIDSVTTYSR
jgi:hypothetical protein